MIHLLNICGQRDQDLSILMRKTFVRYCIHAGEIETRNFDNNSRLWGNGAGWEACTLKLDALRAMLRFGIRNTDYIACVDSDVVFTSDEVFKYIHTYGIIGIENASKAQTFIGPLTHMSGCFLCLRGDIVKAICDPAINLEALQREFKSFVLCENEDVFLSYLAQKAGADSLDLPHHLYDVNFEQDLSNNALKSFYHLNYLPSKFMDEPVTGKWDIPKVLKAKEIYL